MGIVCAIAQFVPENVRGRAEVCAPDDPLSDVCGVATGDYAEFRCDQREAIVKRVP